MITAIATRDAAGAYVVEARVVPCASQLDPHDTLWLGCTVPYVVDTGASHTTVRRDLLPAAFRFGPSMRTRFADGRVADSPTAVVHLAVLTATGPRVASVRALVTDHGFNLLGLDLVKGLQMDDGRTARVMLGHVDAIFAAPARSDSPTIDRLIVALARITEVLAERDIAPLGCRCHFALEGGRQ